MENMTLVPTDAPVDPTLFAVNWDVTFEVLVMIVVLAFFMERALAVLFESELYVRLKEKHPRINAKTSIAFVAAAGCWLWQFDGLSILLQREQMTVLGTVLTGAVIAGGSKAAIKLFHDVLDVKSSAYRRAQAAAKQAAAETAPAESELVLGRVVALERAVAEIAETSLDRQTGRLRESGRTASEKHD